MLSGKIIAVFGGSECSDEVYQQAWEIGQLIARNHGIVICGGLFGVMEAVCKGASEEGGVTIGILPGDDIYSANPYVRYPVATGMGIGRNVIIARTAQVCIAIDGRYGTLSEVAYALQLGKPVIGLNFWVDVPGIIHAKNPADVIRLVMKKI